MPIYVALKIAKLPQYGGVELLCVGLGTGCRGQGVVGLQRDLVGLMGFKPSAVEASMIQDE